MKQETRKKKRNQKGFTLVEMIVVIAIIGVLAAMMVPSLMGYINKANTSNNRVAATTIGRTVQSSLTEKNNTNITLITGVGSSSGVAILVDPVPASGNDNDKVKSDLTSIYTGEKFTGTFGVKVQNGVVQKVLYNPKGTAAPTLAQVTSSSMQSSATEGIYPES